MGKIRNFFYRLNRFISSQWFFRIYQPFFMKRYASKTYKKIIARKPNDSVILFTGAGLGDTLYAMAYLSAYKNKNPNHTVYVVATCENSEIVKSFIGGGGDINVFITKRKYLRLFRFLATTEFFECEIKNRILNALIPAFVTDGKHPEMLHQLRTHVFQLDEVVSIQYHGMSPEKEVNCIPNFNDLCQKIVLINQSSNSCHLCAEAKKYFEQIVQFLTYHGFLVYCNTVEAQLPIKGSIAVSCKLQELLAITQKIPLVVSIRSGILDFLVSTNVNMFVYYPRSNLHKEIYSLSGWQCNGIYMEVGPNELNNDSDLSLFRSFISSIGLISDSTSPTASGS